MLIVCGQLLWFDDGCCSLCVIRCLMLSVVVCGE